MANYKTSTQRRNEKMEKIFAAAKSERKGLVGNSGLKGYGVNSPAMSKARALNAKLEMKSSDTPTPVKK